MSAGSPRLLVSVITGGRPKVSQRPTSALLPDLLDSGVAAEVEYVVREDHAGEYEVEDGVALNVYPLQWADAYALTHWRHPRAQFTAGGFHGAFTGREWAMRSAVERGFDLVLQLDDNILTVGPIESTRTSYYDFVSTSEMVRIAVEVAQATNVAMLGFQLNSAVPRRSLRTLRNGYPYSFFLEKAGPGRMPYYGPFEDDIMHALEYGLNGGPGRTVAVMDPFVYQKESKSKTGMRAHYNAERGLEIAARYPRNVTLREGRRTSSTKDYTGLRGVRHFLNTKGFTPVRVTDRERYTAAEEDLISLVHRCQEQRWQDARGKISRRAGKTDG